MWRIVFAEKFEGMASRWPLTFERTQLAARQLVILPGEAPLCRGQLCDAGVTDWLELGRAMLLLRGEKGLAEMKARVTRFILYL